MGPQRHDGQREDHRGHPAHDEVCHHGQPPQRYCPGIGLGVQLLLPLPQFGFQGGIQLRRGAGGGDVHLGLQGLVQIKMFHSLGPPFPFSAVARPCAAGF